MDIEQFLMEYGHILAVILVWSSIWKAWALWRSARRKDRAWFIAMFLINSLGLLEIFYIFLFSRGQSQSSKEEKKD